MNLKFLLGVATGVGIALFFTSERGKELLETLSDSFSDGLSRGQEALQSASERLEAVKSKVVENARQSAS